MEAEVAEALAMELHRELQLLVLLLLLQLPDLTLPRANETCFCKALTISLKAGCPAVNVSGLLKNVHACFWDIWLTLCNNRSKNGAEIEHHSGCDTCVHVKLPPDQMHLQGHRGCSQGMSAPGDFAFKVQSKLTC